MKVTLTECEKFLAIAGYINGYEQGHHDTVENAYTDSEDSAKEWLPSAINDGGIEYTVCQLSEQ